MKSFLTLACVTMLGSLAVPNSASAGLPFFRSRPRVNEVSGRINNQQGRINNGVASGRLSTQQAGRLQRGDQRIQQREVRDMSMNGGHLTGRETMNLNRAENRESGRISQAKGQGQIARPGQTARPGFFSRLFGRR